MPVSGLASTEVFSLNLWIRLLTSLILFIILRQLNTHLEGEVENLF